ncbi:hypothetical protein [Candidatus Nitronereus thalassa]|uniref:Phenylacetate--CoA ligase family protein n=1 Tax=Candidatus Nitronereus thalassa TaxID=3020898 RepID=A0ABU3K5C1_9BACT|nr:hypothetical protein [Candidatus Nitronereus thalassa]MDT7041557.1 hypothetical protein [Candidatus Nitronereus thalassa]
MAATAHGYYLRSWRFGKETEEIVKAALARDRWAPDKLKAWQAERLGYVLQRAATKVPYYREYWAARRHRGDQSSWEILENWPILDKDQLRANPQAFVAEDCHITQMYHEHTSGTSGKSLNLWWSRNTVRAWYALSEARWRQWYGVSRHDRWAILGGQLVTPVEQRRPPFWVWNQALHQLYMSSYHLAPQLIPYYLDAINRYGCKFLLGYTSSLYALAQEVERLGRTDLKMSVVIANAEPLFDYQRKVIEKAFQCPVRETYGMAEIVAAASECEEGQLHLWPEIGVVEVFQGENKLEDGMSGDLVCTSLLNDDMPLIRYRVGDCGSLQKHNELCDCGRTLPILGSVEGRVDDVLYTLDGRCIGRLDPVFKEDLPVREAQITQESLDQIQVTYVPASDFTPKAGQAIIDGLRARMGPINVTLTEVAEVPRGANGKFRAVVCKIPKEQRQLLQR